MRHVNYLQHLFVLQISRLNIHLRQRKGDQYRSYTTGNKRLITIFRSSLFLSIHGAFCLPFCLLKRIRTGVSCR